MQSKHRAAASSQRLWWHPQNATTCTVKYDAQKNSARAQCCARLQPYQDDKHVEQQRRGHQRAEEHAVCVKVVLRGKAPPVPRQQAVDALRIVHRPRCHRRDTICAPPLVWGTNSRKAFGVIGRHSVLVLGAETR